MWPFKKGKRTEEIRADTIEGTRSETEEEARADAIEESLTPQMGEELLRALMGNKTLTRNEALQIPAVKGSIRILAETVAGLPIRLYEKGEDGKIKEITDDHRIRILNDDTGDTLTAAQFWRAMITDYFVGKGGYAYKNKNYGRIESIHYVECENVSIVKSPDPIFKDYKILVQGIKYDPWDFLILLRNSRDGCKGVPIQEENRMILTAAYYSVMFEMSNAKKGGAKKGFLSSERQLTQDQIDMLKQSWNALFADDTESMMVLNKGLSFNEAQNNAREMQQNELRGTNYREISMLMGVPGKILTGEASQLDYETLIKHGLTPLLVDIEESLDRDLLMEEEKGKKYFAFDTKELTRGSIKERYEAYEIARRNNFMQLDEIRKEEDLPPLGMNYLQLGLDTVLMDPETKKIYTPNTGQEYEMREGGLKNESGTEG